MSDLKLYVIAGEASGDMHAANLMQAMLDKDSAIDFRFWGGDRMASLAGKPVKHIKELAFMGFTEVLANIRTIIGNIKFCKQDILNYRPDAIVLVDYPGFNMRIARFAKKHGIKVFYYISPQIWAWKEKRIHKLKQFVDEMYVILPFEKDFYACYNMEVHFVGHPLLDEIERIRSFQSTREDFLQQHQLEDRKIIALLPGSRKQEIKVKLPVMLSVVKDFPDYQFVIAGAPSQDEAFYESFITDLPVKIVHGKTYQLLTHSYAALVTSGTATLETALFNVPEIVCYKGGAISYQIARRLIRVKYISLVNLVMNREVVKELIQNELTCKNLKKELKELITEGRRVTMLEDFKELKERLGGTGASEETARLMLKTLKQQA